MRLFKSLFKAFLLAAFFVPLFLDIGPIGISTWTGPFLALIYIRLSEWSIGKSRHNKIRIGTWEASGLLFITWMYISTFINSYHHPYSNRDGLLFVYSLSILFAMFVRRNWGSLFRTSTVARLGFAMIAVQSVIGSLQFLTSSTVGFPAKYFGTGGSASLLENKDAVRVIGTLDSTPTVLGRAISIFLPFVAIYPPGSSPRFGQRIYRVIALIAGVVVILLTQSRSAALVVGGVGGLWLLQRLIANLRRAARLRVTWEGLYFSYFLVVAFGGGVVAMQQVGGISYIQQAVTSTVYRFETVAILGTRFELMRGAVILFQEQPILGNGYLSTMYLAEQTDILVPPWRSFLRVHNAYLQFLAEGGLIGFLSYSYFTIYPIYRLWKSNIRNKKIYYPFIIAVLMILFFSQSSTAYDRYSLAPLYMMILGGAMGVVDVSESRPFRGSMREE